jgi:hypothetical protein
MHDRLPSSQEQYMPAPGRLPTGQERMPVGQAHQHTASLATTAVLPKSTAARRCMAPRQAHNSPTHACRGPALALER